MTSWRNVVMFALVLQVGLFNPSQARPQGRKAGSKPRQLFDPLKWRHPRARLWLRSRRHHLAVCTWTSPQTLPRCGPIFTPHPLWWIWMATVNSWPMLHTWLLSSCCGNDSSLRHICHCVFYAVKSPMWPAGSLDIVVGTSVGFVYVLDAKALAPSSSSTSAPVVSQF